MRDFVIRLKLQGYTKGFHIVWIKKDGELREADAKFYRDKNETGTMAYNPADYNGGMVVIKENPKAENGQFQKFQNRMVILNNIKELTIEGVNYKVS